MSYFKEYSWTINDTLQFRNCEVFAIQYDNIYQRWCIHAEQLMYGIYKDKDNQSFKWRRLMCSYWTVRRPASLYNKVAFSLPYLFVKITTRCTKNMCYFVMHYICSKLVKTCHYSWPSCVYFTGMIVVIYLFGLYCRLITHSLSSRSVSQLNHQSFDKSHIRPNDFLLF